MKMTPESSKLNGFDIWKPTLRKILESEIEFENATQEYKHPKTEARKRVKTVYPPKTYIF